MKVIYDKEKQKVPIKIWTDDYEEATLEQLVNMSNHPAVFHHVVAAPDAHPGYGVCIGGILPLKNAVSPYAVGVDIACGILAVKLNLTTEDIDRDVLINVMRGVRKYVPMGKARQNGVRSHLKLKATELLDTHIGFDGNIFTEDAVAVQLGTLGGGNHYAELQKDEEDNLWIMIHSGSRNLGYQTCNKYHKSALEENKRWFSDMPTDKLAFLPIDSELGKRYLICMALCMDFSYKNRLEMLTQCCRAFSEVLKTKIFEKEDVINVHHNYAAVENHFGHNVWVHRKGAIRARKGDIGLISGTMGTASYVVRGLGNPESFCSASHGAGRKGSRKWAKENIKLVDFKESMKDVVFHIDENHLDESPQAYKDIYAVMENQKDLVDIVHTLTPLAVEKG